MKKVFAAILCLLFLSFDSDAQKKPVLPDTAAGFDAYIQKAIKDWEVPGLAIAVVKNNQVVFKKTYGTRELGSNKPVDNQTLFVCASTTKAMTAACMGILVDQGKLNWDDPVIKYLPGFRLYDPFVTRDLRVRDLLLHNSGVGNTDYLWSENILSSEEVIDHMQLVKPSYPLRSGFIYQNIFYLIAGKVIEKISGITWAEFISRNIFQPLGMNRTRAELKLVTGENMAIPHYRIDSTITVIEHDTADAIGPAGSVWSSIDDISLWMKSMLDSSKYSGGRLLKPATWAEMLKPQTIVSDAEFYPTQKLTQPNFKTYAFGWFQQDYKGRKLNFHTGSLSGAVAIHAQMPEEKTGVYIFANLDHAEIRHALMLKALDLYAVGGTRDWSTDLLALYSNINKEDEKRRKELEQKRVLNTNPSLQLASYAGKYTDPLYGTVEINLANGKLNAKINQKLTGSLQHWNYDTFQLVFDKKSRRKSLLIFNLTTDGKVKDLALGMRSFKKE